MIRYALFAIAVLLVGVILGLAVSKLRRPSPSAQRSIPSRPRRPVNWPALAAVLTFAAAAAVAIAMALAES